MEERRQKVSERVVTEKIRKCYYQNLDSKPDMSHHNDLNPDTGACLLILFIDSRTFIYFVVSIAALANRRLCFLLVRCVPLCPLTQVVSI